MRSAAMFLMVAMMACGGGGSTPTSTTGGTTGGTGGTGPTGPTGPSTTNQISVLDASFSPSATTVAPGTTVTWTWNTPVTHNVTFTNASLGASADKSSGTYSKLFPTAGSFPYGCTLHPGMNGTITVQ